MDDVRARRGLLGRQLCGPEKSHDVWFGSLEGKIQVVRSNKSLAFSIEPLTLLH